MPPPSKPKPKTCSYDSALAQGAWVRGLCIGVDEYTHLSKLTNAVLDARAIARKVQDLPGKSTAVGPDEERQCGNPVSKGSLQKVLKTFLAGLVSAPPRVVLVYFAGHGIRTGSKIFLVPANAKLEEGHDLEQMCMSMDEVWKLFKEELDDKIEVRDVLFLVILDTCQNLPYNLKKGLSEESLEPDVRDRPKCWALCTAAARGQEAQDGAAGGHSPFNSELLSPQCGLFEQNVSFEHALKVACGRLRASGLQEPQLFNINNLDADLTSICLYGPEREISEQHDVFLCFREDAVERKLAHTLQCRLNEEIGAIVGRDGERRRPKVFFEPQIGRGFDKEQVADALCSSQIVVLLVSHSTWQGIGQMHTDCPPDDPLPRLLARYEMILELHEQERIRVLPVLIGSENAGRAFYQGFDQSDNDQLSQFWPIQTLPKDLRAASVVKSALDGLRSDFEVAQNLADKQLKVEAPSILRSPDGQMALAGRSVWQTLQAFRSRQHFPAMQFVGEERDAMNKVIKVIKEIAHLFDIPPGKRARRENDESEAGAGSKRANTDSREGSKAAEKRPHEAGEGSSSRAKKPRQDSEPASMSGVSRVGGEGAASQGGRAGQGKAGGAGRVPLSAIVGDNNFKYHVFISHNWGREPEFSDHMRAEKLNRRLQEMGFETWFDGERMTGNILDKMTKGIQESVVFLACVTRSYIQKVEQEASPNDNVKMEFNHARRVRQAPFMLAVVMEEDMTDTRRWTGSVGATLGDHLYVKLTSDVEDEFEHSVAEIVGEIDKRLADILPHELQAAASEISSRLPSPAPSERSDVSTEPRGSEPPQSPSSQEVFAIHVDNNVREFRDDMKKLIEGFLTSQSGAGGEQPALRQFRWCELLLAAFMRNKVAPSCDAETVEDLDWWRGMCVKPGENLVERFHEMCYELKPPVLAEINFPYPDSPKKYFASIFVIDWMVRSSPWALRRMAEKGWRDEIVKGWFDQGHAESSEIFLERAETFLEGVPGHTYGTTILGKVIQTNSYVIFFRMESLTALLFREFFHHQHASEHMQLGFPEPGKRGPSLPPISLVLSSSNWHWPGAKGNGISAAHQTGITARLQRIASLPNELLEANSRSMSQIDDVKWEPLYSLVEVKGKTMIRNEARKDDDETSAQASLAATRPRTSLHSQSESKRVSGPASRQTESHHVSGSTSRHEPRTRPPMNPQKTDKAADETLKAGIRTLEKVRESVYTNRVTEIFYRDSATRASIRRYLQQLIQQDTAQKDRLSVGSYIDSASGETRLVDGGSVALELLANRSFLEECNKCEEAVMKDLRCPISGGLLQNPVTCSDGHTYERAFIVQRFRQAEVEFEDKKSSVGARKIFEFMSPKSPMTKQPLEFRLKEGSDRRELKFNEEIGEEIRAQNEAICAKIKQFKERKLVELNSMKQIAEGEEEKRILRTRHGYHSQAGDSLETMGTVFDSAKEFFDWIVARSQAGLACLTGPPASGKTVTMQQIVYAAVQECFAKMETDGSKPLIPVFMRAAVLSQLISKCDHFTLSRTDREPEQLLREVLAEFLNHGIQQGIFEKDAKTVILDLYDYGRVFICIDGLDEAAAHQEMLEVWIEHAVRSAQQQSQRRLHVLLSTREHSYVHSRACLRLGDFDVVNLQPLNDARQQQLIWGRIPSGEIDTFREQLDAIAGKNQELATSPFLLSLMIEVYRKEGEIPSRRVDLYDKQVGGIVKRCIQVRLRDQEASGSLVAENLLEEKLSIATRFLETLAFVCQMRLAARDLKLDACVPEVSELWQEGEAALAEAQQLLFAPTVGLLADVGGGSYRFSHLTLQEYLAARCALRLYQHAGARTMLEQLRQGKALFSRWKREVLQFTACMLPEEMFPEFCQALLETDDGTGACCELVRDFLQERGASEAVEKMMRDQMQQNRGADLLLAGLCHPCPEMRSLVLSEMKQFGVPPNPFADGTVPRLKEIAKDTGCVWHERAAAMLSLAQIAQMTHWETSRADRAETIRWMLTMLQSDRDVLENVNAALVKALGTMLQEGGVSATGDGIMLQPEDENVLLQSCLRENVAVANALADLRIFSAGLVDWLERDPSLIAQGKWPIRHVHFLCENVTALNDSGRALRFAGSLLHRLHSPSFQTSDRDLLLKGLRAVQELSAADGWLQKFPYLESEDARQRARVLAVAVDFLPFLESGEAKQRARVLEAAVEVNVRFEGEDAIGRLARCLFLNVGSTRTHAASETSLLSYVLKEAKEKCKGSSLREKSAVFKFLNSTMEQSSGAAQQAVCRELLDFERKFEAEKRENEEKEKERRRKQAEGSARDEGRAKAKQEDRREQQMEEEIVYDDQEKEGEVSIEGLAAMVSTFTPSMLSQKQTAHKSADRVYLYIAALVWGRTGLFQEVSSDHVANWLHLSSSASARAASALKALDTFTHPWVKGKAEIDGAWGQKFYATIQSEQLGRVLFGLILQNTRESIQCRLGGSLSAHLSQEKTIQELEIKSAQQKLEKSFLLKEFRIGRRAVEIPVWEGLVSPHQAQVDMASELSSTLELEQTLSHQSNWVNVTKELESIRTFGRRGSNSGELAHPGGIHVSSEPNCEKIVVADGANHRVQVFDLEGAFQCSYGEEGSGMGQLQRPRDVCLTEGHDIVVADTGNHRIQIFHNDGSISVLGAGPGSEPGLLTKPSGVAVCQDGRLVVADSGNHRIQIFNRDGSVNKVFGSSGLQEGFFKEPRAVAINSRGEILVSDTNNHRIQIFDDQARLKHCFGRLGDGHGEFRMPRKIAIGPYDDIVVADKINNRVQVFMADGTFIQSYGGEDDNAGLVCDGPVGVAVGPQGHIYVTEFGNDRVSVLVARRKKDDPMPKVTPASLTFEAGARAEGWRGLRLAALCVGVGDYAKHAKLGNTVRDAEAVYHAVNACPGCRAAIIRDPPDKKTIRKHLRAFLEELAPTGGNGAPPETVLLFVAGRGVQLGHHVYLIPTAASSDDETDLSEDCLSHLTLFEWLHRFLDAPANYAQPKRFDVKFAVILDVCREPAAVPDAHSGQVLVSIDPERGAAPERWALCYSTSRGSVALDGDAGSHSPLALGMLDARSGICAPGVALKQGIENACAAVRESTRQRPITVTLDVLGDFVLQPGPDRDVPPGFSGTLSRNPRPSGRCPRVFLGYRVDSDQDLVERLYYQLKSEGIDVWWDARCLPPGQPWEEGFADGLCSSDVYVPVISKAALAPCASLTPESKCDNVLLEHQLALELKMRGELHCIFPVFVGVLERHGQLGEIYGDFFKGDGMPSCPEVMVGSVEAKLSENLFRKGKGVPQLPDAKRKVAGTLTAITEHQGVLLSGMKRDAVQNVVDEIVRMCDEAEDDEDPAVKWRRKYEERKNHRRASSQNPRADTGISLPASNDAAALEVPAATAAGPGSR